MYFILGKVVFFGAELVGKKLEVHRKVCQFGEKRKKLFYGWGDFKCAIPSVNLERIADSYHYENYR